MYFHKGIDAVSSSVRTPLAELIFYDHNHYAMPIWSISHITETNHWNLCVTSIWRQKHGLIIKQK